jgi:hypothetical protein
MQPGRETNCSSLSPVLRLIIRGAEITAGANLRLYKAWKFLSMSFYFCRNVLKLVSGNGLFGTKYFNINA